MSVTGDFSLDFDFGGEQDEPRDSAAGGSDSPLDSVLAEKGLIPTAAELSFDPMPMRPVEDTPKWSVGAVTAGVDAEDFSAICNAVYTDYTRYAKLPDVARIQLLSMVSPKIVACVVDSREFRSAMAARGINWVDTKGLTAQQMLALQVLTNPTDKRSLQAKLKSLEITYPVYRAWMRQPAFSQYMFTITEGMLTDHLPDFNTVLTNKGLAGDLNAIRYINELSGRHDPNRQQVVDLVAIVDKLLEIIQRNVTDPAVFQKIAAEFSMTVNSKTSIQGEITRGPNT